MRNPVGLSRGVLHAYAALQIKHKACQCSAATGFDLCDSAECDPESNRCRRLPLRDHSMVVALQGCEMLNAYAYRRFAG